MFRHFEAGLILCTTEPRQERDAAREQTSLLIWHSMLISVRVAALPVSLKPLRKPRILFYSRLGALICKIQQYFVTPDDILIALG
jgi:hypothetical protein